MIKVKMVDEGKEEMKMRHGGHYLYSTAEH